MAEIKDKFITVESLKALHDYNTETYETIENVGSQFDNVNNNLLILMQDVENHLLTKFDKPQNNIIPIANGGTNASNGAIGLENLLKSGAMVLSPYQYGDTLPAAGTVGRIFFKKLSE